MSHKPPSSTSQRPAAPAFDILVSVPNDSGVRLVYGSVELLATASVNAYVRAEAETGIGTSVYDVVFEAYSALGLLQVMRHPYTFVVEGGRRYRFVKGAGVGVTETVLHYSYTDL